MATVAINGLGRIGRAALKILLDADGLELVRANDIIDADNLAYLIKYDTVYGRYHREVSAVDGALVVDGRRIPALAERDPAKLPVGRAGRRVGARVHRAVQDRGRPSQACSGRRVVRDPVRTDEFGDRAHGGARREPPAGPATDHLLRAARRTASPR